MKHYQFIKLRDVLEQINNGMPTNYDFRCVRDLWDMALYKNRVQNDLIKQGYENDVIYTFTAFDPQRQKVINYEVKAGKNQSRMEWLILLASVERYCNIEEIRTNINNIKQLQNN